MRSNKRAKSIICSRNLAARVLLSAALGIAFLSAGRAEGQTVTVSVVPDADTFVRSAAPASNYGSAGALSVSGSTATNGSGVQNGLLDTLMRFPVSNLVASLDAALGAQSWVITNARLVLTETAAPDSDIFNRGVGAFEVRWLASDGWTEGSGKPVAPTTDGVAWQNIPGLLNSNSDVSVGAFTNSGANGEVACALALANRFIDDIRFGGDASFYLTASSPQVGFTFNSRSFGNASAQPRLEISAVAAPNARIESIAVVGTNAVVSFGTVSNRAYRLQGADVLPGSWSNLLALPAQPTNSHVVFVEGATNRQRFYRLSISP